MIEVRIKDSALREAAGEGMDAFVDCFVGAIKETIGGELTAETMVELNSDQVTLLAWDVLHEEVMDGGFVQLIHNGYGPFIFKNPLAKALKLWGLRELSKLIYSAHTLYIKYATARTTSSWRCSSSSPSSTTWTIRSLRKKKSGLQTLLTISTSILNDLQRLKHELLEQREQNRTRSNFAES